MPKPELHQDIPDDPLFIHARRELRFTLFTWLVFAVWVIGVSWWRGRLEPGVELRTVMGMPAWVFWGVGVPWVAANVVTFWFCFGYMADDPLDVVPGEQFSEAEKEGEEGDEGEGKR